MKYSTIMSPFYYDITLLVIWWPHYNLNNFKHDVVQNIPKWWKQNFLKILTLTLTPLCITVPSGNVRDKVTSSDESTPQVKTARCPADDVIWFGWMNRVGWSEEWNKKQNTLNKMASTRKLGIQLIIIIIIIIIPNL